MEGPISNMMHNIENKLSGGGSWLFTRKENYKADQ
jgi:hypothetical protein